MKERAVIDNAVDVICLIDTSGRFVSVNPAAASVLGISPEDLVGRSLADFLLAADLDSSLSAAIGAEESIDKIAFENRWKRQDGKVINLLWSAHWSAKDKGLFCVVHDITERKLAEELLRKSEERVRLILESLPVALILISERGYIEFVNYTGEALTGYTSTELVGERVRKLFPERLTSDAAAQLQALLDECSGGVVDATALTKTGENVAVQLSVSRLADQETKFLIAALDVRARHEVETLRREFVSIVSHDLRTPLSSVKALVKILPMEKFGRLNQEGLGIIAIVDQEINRLMKLVRDLLELAKMEAGKISLERSQLGILNIIDDSVRAVKGVADARDIAIYVDSPDLPIIADGDRLVQVLVNLLSNAIKFSEAGQTVRIKAELLSASIKVSVIDNGRGIPEEAQARIFEKFQQVTASDAREKAGTGLGLTICRMIIDAHGGKIGVESLENSGSTFWFELPV